MNPRKTTLIDKLGLMLGSEVPQDPPAYYQESNFYANKKYRRTWAYCAQPDFQDFVRVSKDTPDEGIVRRYKRITNRKFLERLIKSPRLYIQVEREDDLINHDPY